MSNGPEEISERIVELLPRLRRFARSLSRNQHDADDLVQSSVERAWRHLDQLRPGASLHSWLFGIMKNAWVDNLRSRQRRGEVALPEDSGDHPAVNPADVNASLWSVSEAMDKLPEEQRLAVARAQEHVVGLQVAVQDPLGVGVRQGLGQARPQPHDLLR